MRASLFSVLLGAFIILAGNPGLADNDAAAGKNVNPPGPSTDSAPITTSTPSTSATSPDANPAPPSTPAPGETTSAAAPASDVAALDPHKRPMPEGYAAAVELFKQRKFPQAQKEFEKIIQSGTADVNTHLCLAHCFLQQKIYTKAIKEFDWLAKYAKNSMTLQKNSEHTARSLRNAMNGICPANCIKPNDPRWTIKAGAKVIQYPHSGGGYDTFTPNNIGQLIVFEHGNAVVKGTCPVCEGTTQIPVLKDGGTMPRI
ncbi:MAG: hypothetical protein IT343_00150 [Candidatus Melainabacteria bacterium]|jgi:hypothetical protein|nr:hypothetical protein [Candidatus Melainabacteria bacterium]